MAKQDITDREEGRKVEKLPQEGYAWKTQDSIRKLMKNLNETRYTYIRLCDDLKKRGIIINEKIEEGYSQKIKSCMQDCAYIISCIEYANIVDDLWPDFIDIINGKEGDQA